MDIIITRVLITLLSGSMYSWIVRLVLSFVLAFIIVMSVIEHVKRKKVGIELKKEIPYIARCKMIKRVLVVLCTVICLPAFFSPDAKVLRAEILKLYDSSEEVNDTLPYMNHLIGCFKESDLHVLYSGLRTINLAAQLTEGIGNGTIASEEDVAVYENRLADITSTVEEVKMFNLIFRISYIILLAVDVVLSYLILRRRLKLLKQEEQEKEAQSITA